MRRLLCLVRHPGRSVDVLIERSLDGLYHLQHAFLIFRREVFGDVGLPDGFAQIDVGVNRAAPPAWLNLLCSAQGASEEIEVFLDKRLAERGCHRVHGRPPQVCPPLLDGVRLDQLFHALEKDGAVTRYCGEAGA